MSRKTPNRPVPRHATVAAYLALFLALAGTAWAAATIGSGDVVNNSLKSADLKNGAAVKSADVSNGSLGGGDVRNGSLRGRDFTANSLGGADVSEPTLRVGRIVHRLGGPVGAQVTNSLAYKAVPNTTFTQGPTESDQIFPSARITMPASCTAPRQFTAYLMMDDPTFNPLAVIGSLSFTDAGPGALTRTLAFGNSPFGVMGTSLFRTGTTNNHQFFLQAAGSCNTGGGITIDSVEINVVGHR